MGIESIRANPFRWIQHGMGSGDLSSNPTEAGTGGKRGEPTQWVKRRRSFPFDVLSMAWDPAIRQAIRLSLMSLTETA